MLYIVVFIVLIISLCFITPTLFSNGNLYNKGYYQTSDTTEIMLDRIQWANHYTGRLNRVPRYIFFAISIATSSSIILLNKMPDPILFIGTTVCAWLFLMCFSGFFSHHADKFANFAVDQNVNKLREKLGCTKGDFSKLEKQTDKFSPNDGCPNFVYSPII
jgi:hypothetical protein